MTGSKMFAKKLRNYDLAMHTLISRYASRRHCGRGALVNSNNINCNVIAIRDAVS